MNLLLTLLGIFSILFVAYDVYSTILDARLRAGPISEFINRTSWNISRLIAFRLSRSRRHRFLNAIGPLLLPALIIIYIILLVSGFALIYYPSMPVGFNISHNREITAWFEAFYFSGITLSTVGYGDITPHTIPMRLVALIEGASGFALISLAVTYLITIYRALERKRVVALSFYHQAEEGADVAGYIAHHFVDGRFHGLDSLMRIAARDLQELLESHVEHPIIHYFHPVEVYKSLPRVLFLTLETPTVIQSCLDRNEYVDICRSPDARTLEASARHVLDELVVSLGLDQRKKQNVEQSFEESKRWRKRYRQTLNQLDQAGIKTGPDIEEGWEAYRSRREEWEAPLYRFAQYLGYDWDEVTGDRDLEYAADEEMKEPRGKEKSGVRSQESEARS